MAGSNTTFNISPKPQWSFGEVVQHAWQVYSGRGIESGGRRNVLFRIWAAMVGATRAIAEVDHFIEAYGGYLPAADAIGCKVSTLKTLRKQFGLVDEVPLAPVSLALAQGEQLRGLQNIYEVDGAIGAGGMGVVYRVHRIQSAEAFAAKLLSSDRFAITNAVRDRFVRESSLASSFSSRRVVRSVECLHHRGSLVTVMELLSGATLYDRLLLPRNQVSPAQRYEWLVQIVEGVAHLHGHGVVHRDLSPRNCLLRQDESVAVGDFGVARRIDDATVTTFHERMGSLIYISPQQREDPHSAALSDDVFAMGQIAYHLLTGTSPHGGIERIADLKYPEELDEWVRKLRNPDPVFRPQTGRDALVELEALGIDRDSLPLFLP